jgi:hypothetical protein
MRLMLCVVIRLFKGMSKSSKWYREFDVSKDDVGPVIRWVQSLMGIGIDS